MSQTALSDVNPEIIANYDMRADRCKRREYTRGLAEASLPSNMSPDWERLALTLRDLYSKLGNHPAMAPNLEQTFSTPANSKNSVYFMWDFVGRTLHQLYMVPARTERLNTRHKEDFSDCEGRATMAACLIMNDPPGVLEKMVKSAPHDKGPQPQMGQEVEDAARRLIGYSQ